MAAKFQYVGNPKDRSDNRGEITFRGITFRRGEDVEVQDEEIAKKLRGNTHFVEAGGKKPVDQRTEIAKANQKPVDPRATVVPTYKDADSQDVAVRQGAGESGFGYNHEADEADRKLAQEVREKEKAASEGRLAPKTGISRPK